MKNHLRKIGLEEKSAILEMHQNFKKSLNEQTLIKEDISNIPNVKKVIRVLEYMGYKRRGNSRDKIFMNKYTPDKTLIMIAMVMPEITHLMIADEADFAWQDAMKDPSKSPEAMFPNSWDEMKIRKGVLDFEKQHGYPQKSPKKPTPKKPTNNLPKPEPTKPVKPEISPEDMAESILEKKIKKVLREALLNEDEPEPVLSDGGEVSSGIFKYDEGKVVPKTLNGVPFTPQFRDRVVKRMSDTLKRSLYTIQRFEKSDFDFPPFIVIKVGTSSSGGPDVNSSVAEGRANYLRQMVFDAFALHGIRKDIVQKLITNNLNATYRPSGLDVSFYDEKIVPPIAGERFGEIFIKDLRTMGKEMSHHVQTVSQLNASDMDSWWERNVVSGDDIDETKIVDALLSPVNGPQTYSDIQNINSLFRAQNTSLETWLNDNLDERDNDEKRKIVNALDRAARRSGCQSGTIRLVNDSRGDSQISINLGATCNQR